MFGLRKALSKCYQLCSCKVALEKIDPQQFGDASARKFRQHQMDSVKTLTEPMMIGNVIFASLLFVNLISANTAMNILLGIWVLVISSASLYTVYKIRTNRKKEFRSTGSQHSVQKLVMSSAVLSALWCAPIGFMYFGFDGGQFGLVTAVMVGIMAAGAGSLARVPQAAVAWVLVATVNHVAVAIYAGISSGQLADFTMAFFAVVACFGFIASILERAKAAFQTFQNSEELIEKSEVIDLLLKDYEAQASEWLWETDANGYAVRAPQQVLEMMGVSQEMLKDTPVHSLSWEYTTFESEQSMQRLMEALDAQEEFHDITLTVEDVKSGETRWIMARGKPQYENNEFVGYRGICADATAAAEAEQKIRYLARHDSLTDLSNRTVFTEKITSWNTSKLEFFTMLIDLDRFKAVNDSLGHAAGDNVLVQVAERLKAVMNESGFTRSSEMTIARIGGDEFALACANDRRSNNVRDLTKTAEQIAERIVDEMAVPFNVDGKDIQVGASVGYALAPEDGDEISRLTNRADMALYRAKNSGRGVARRFNFSMDEENRSARELEIDVCNALRLGQLKIAYQPIMAVGLGADGNAALQEQTGMEALLRWEHPTKGNISPEVFIPIAEETGSIIQIGEWVLREACSAAVNWKTEACVAVNVSIKQVQSPNFVQTVLGALASSGLSPNRLEIEMTESIMVTDSELTISIIRQLRNLGIRISLDDFGTGYSSLSYISDFDVDRIKIDRSFVEKLDDPTANAAAIISAVANLANSLGLKTVGEGVETLEQAQKLAELGCDHQQGFYFGRPEIMENIIDQTQSADIVDVLPENANAKTLDIAEPKSEKKIAS